MRNDGPREQVAEASPGTQVASANEGREIAGSELVPRTCRIRRVDDGVRRLVDRLLVVENHRPLAAEREGAVDSTSLKLLDDRAQRLAARELCPLLSVAENHVEFAADGTLEPLAVSIDEEPIAKRECELRPETARRREPTEQVPGRRIEQVPLHVADASPAEEGKGQVVRIERSGNPERGDHRPLAELVHKDERARRRAGLAGLHQHDLDASLCELAYPFLTQVVMAYLGHHGNVDPKRRQAHRRIGRRATADDLRLPPDALEKSLNFANAGERHRPPGKPEPIDLARVHAHRQVDDRRAHRYNFTSCHARSLPAMLVTERGYVREASVAAVTEQNPYRLVRVWTPSHYDLTLRVDPRVDAYTGRVRISGDLATSTDVIEVHAVDLAITQASVEAAGGHTALEPRLRAEHGVLELHAERPLPAGPFLIDIVFSGALRRDLEGLYLSRYVDEDGTEHRIATTQFESTGARKAFPCFDEPDAKATFAITLEVPSDLEAFSNYPVVERVALDDGFDRWRFATTMRMSTYLVAMVVGRFEATSPLMHRDVPIRVVHVPGKGHLASFALEVAAHALAFFEEYFAIPYPAAKLDLLAIPDFAAGAMENLGAVTFRETALLVDEKRAAQVELERVADVVCHELAHMWFGDLVTMRWWNGLWLNEAFATFMEVTAVDAFRPEWRRWEAFAIGRAAAMGVDALPSTRPIEYTVLAPDDAEDMFDLLTYEKGASILRMASEYLGAEVFRDGVRRYLRQRAYDNAETTDLWDALSEASGSDVASMMNTWVFQGGHPLVSVEALPDGVRLTQSPFRLLNEEDDPIGAIGSLWHVPVALRSLADGERRMLLDQPEAPVEVGPAPIVVNAHGDGVFRTRYAQPLLAQLVESFERLETLERFNLLSDAWALVQASMAPLEDFAGLARHLSAERDPNILGVGASALAFLERIAEPDELAQVRLLAAQIFRPVLDALGFEPQEDDSPQDRTARAIAYDVLGDIAEDVEVREHARERFREEMSGVGGPSGDLAAAVLGLVARFGDESDFAFILDRYRHPRDPQDEQRHLFSLAEFRQLPLGRRVLDLAMTEVRTQDAPFLINRVIANPALQSLALDVLFARFDEMLERFPTNTIDRMLQSLALVVGPTTYRRADEIMHFFEEHPIPAGKRVLAQTLERYQVNLRMRARLAGNLRSQLA